MGRSSNTQQHFAYLANDLAISDAWWDGNSWHLEKINACGNTTGPAAAGTPFGCNFNQQQHIGYPDNAGNIWDSWYDGSGHWNLQKINNGGMTKGASAAGGVFIWVTGKEQHFTYSDGHGMIWDSFWRSDESSFSIAVNPTSIVATLNLDLHGPDTGSIQGPISLTITSNGNYNFVGHLNNSNLLPYNVAVLIALKSRSGTVFLFSVSQTINGCFNQGNNATIKDVWGDLQAECTGDWRASGTLDLSALWNEIQSGIGVITKVVEVVGAIG
jgi:hypothetical protein